MIIKSNIKNYNVNISNELESALSLEYDEKTFLVVDKKIYHLYEKELFAGIPKEKLYILEAVEENKRIETALEICEKMVNIPAKRNVKLISFGGGIVQDITGFVANILYRGVLWIFFPTTLLAACDSCIGGKTSLNYKKFKNLLGTFYPPDEINICTPFFDTLSEKDFLSGLGEVVKFNIMLGESGISNMENNIEALLKREKSKLEEFVESSLKFKKTYIEEDEFDKGIRIHLNFAHTFAHAFETISNYLIPHGTAVAMGTIVANRISLHRGWLKECQVTRMEEVLRKIIKIDEICVDIDALMAAMYKDKKQVGKELTAVLMRDDMDLRVVHDVSREEIEKAVQSLFLKIYN